MFHDYDYRMKCALHVLPNSLAVATYFAGGAEELQPAICAQHESGRLVQEEVEPRVCAQLRCHLHRHQAGGWRVHGGTGL